MRSDHEERSIVLSAKEFQRVDSVSWVGVKRMDRVLLVEVDRVGELESMLNWPR